MRTVQGQLAALGITVGATGLAIQSARLDKTLTQIGLTAGVGSPEVKELRAEHFRLARETGQPVEDLQAGFNSLIQAGVSWDRSLQVIQAMNVATGVTGANAQVLAQGLQVAARAFEFDLSKPGMALELLDKMTVAGRLGNAELEDLAGVFGRVGNAAATAGMKFDEALALVEGLSQSLPGQPERLATRAESTLRLFTNSNYLRAAQAATGVAFFDKDGARRNAVEVLSDLKVQFDKFGTDLERQRYLSKAFGKADLDTIVGIRELLTGGNLAQVIEMNRQIAEAGGTLERDLDRGLNNAVDQVGRLKSVLRSAADSFIRPINEGLNRAIKGTLDSREEGGLGLSGGQIIGGTAAALLGGYALKRFGGPLLGRLLGSAGSVAGGVAAGKALEAAAGITPVFVTNWPTSLGGTGDALAGALGGAGARGAAARVFGGWRAAAGILATTPLKNIATLGAGGIAGSLGGVAAAGAAGYGVGTLINKTLIEGTEFQDKLGAAIAHTLAFFGNDEARESINMRKRAEAELNGTLKIQIDDQRTRITEMSTDQRGVVMDAAVGRLWSMP
jgi:TP901 family phage tail tape measure protein